MSDSVPAPDFNPQPDPPGAREGDEELVQEAGEDNPEPYPPGPSASPSEQDDIVPAADEQ